MSGKKEEIEPAGERLAKYNVVESKAVEKRRFIAQMEKAAKGEEEERLRKQNTKEEGADGARESAADTTMKDSEDTAGKEGGMS
jgi:hypothetical protein